DAIAADRERADASPVHGEPGQSGAVLVALAGVPVAEGRPDEPVARHRDLGGRVRGSADDDDRLALALHAGGALAIAPRHAAVLAVGEVLGRASRGKHVRRARPGAAGARVARVGVARVGDVWATGVLMA